MKGMTPLQQEAWLKNNENTPSVASTAPSVASTVPMVKSDTESNQGIEEDMAVMDTEAEDDDEEELDGMGFEPPLVKRSRETVQETKQDEEKQYISKWSEASAVKGKHDDIKFRTVVSLLRHIREVFRRKSDSDEESRYNEDILQTLIDGAKRFPFELRQLQFVMQQDLPPPKIKSDENAKEPSAKRRKVLTFNFKTDPTMERDYATGATALSEKKGQVSDFIRKCRQDLQTYEEWNDSTCSYAMDFEQEKEVVAKATIGDSCLLSVCLSLASRLKRSEAETKKLVYLVGFGVDRMMEDRAHWNTILQEEHFGHLCESTLRRYRDFYRLMKQYPMFLRANVSYSALLRYKDTITKVLGGHQEADAFWSQSVDAEVPKLLSGYFH
jgi:hypothetical protein